MSTLGLIVSTDVTHHETQDIKLAMRPPHSPEEIIEQIEDERLIYGCIVFVHICWKIR